MPRSILPGLAVCLLSVGFVSAAEPKTIEVGKNPESVCRGFGGKLYVTLINGDEPGDGTIAAVDGDKVEVFAKGFNAPKGIAFVGDYLVAADETTMWKIDKTGKATKLVEAKDFPEKIEFLNDVAASKDNTSVYVTEMSSPSPMFDPSGERKLWDVDSDEAKKLPKKGCVYKVTLKGEVSVAVPPGSMEIRFPNGVTVEEDLKEDKLFIGDFFTGNVYSYVDKKFTLAATGLRGVDGLTVTKDTIYGSSWIQGKVWKVDRKTKESKVILEGLQSAADFYYDAKNKQLIVPDMLAGTLVFLKLD